MCHVAVRPTDFFCYNCGRNLKPKPPSTNASGLIALFLVSILLPPMGIIWGFKYVRQPDQNSKIAGIAAMVVTVIVIIATVQFTVNLMNTVSDQVNSQLQGIGGF